jgi:predicted transcriptional regulator of viral defense system
MRPQLGLRLLVPLLLSQPVFTAKEAREVGVSASVLSYYVGIGKLKRLGRGVYQGMEYQNASFRWADLIEVVRSIKGGVICLISALAVYDLTEEIPRQHWIGIRHETSIRKNKRIRVMRFRNLELGKVEIELDGSRVSIFDRERTIIDSFRFLDRETAIKALRFAIAKRGKERIDLVRLEEYAKKLRFDIAPYLLSVTT